MNKKSNDNTTIELVGAGYTLDQAVRLMHHEVIKIENAQQKRTLENTGVVLGILHLNEEIELVVQFFDHIEQFNQAEFETKLTVIT